MENIFSTWNWSWNLNHFEILPSLFILYITRQDHFSNHISDVKLSFRETATQLEIMLTKSRIKKFSLEKFLYLCPVIYIFFFLKNKFWKIQNTQEAEIFLSMTFYFFIQNDFYTTQNFNEDFKLKFFWRNSKWS